MEQRPQPAPTKTAPGVKTPGKAAAGKMAVKKASTPRGAGAAVPPDRPLKESKGREKSLIRRRLPRTAAVGLTVVPGGPATASTVNDILKRVQTEIPNLRTRIGIRKIRPRRAATGDLLMEIPGADASHKADELAALLREHIGEAEGVKVTRPVRRVDLRIVGMVDAISPRDIAEAISAYSDKCCPEDVRVGPIRTDRNGMNTVWVQAPAIAGVPAAEAREIQIGIFDLRVVLLKGRPTRCFRCLAPGHVQRRCPCPRDRSRCCFNCGSEGHLAANCRERPHCVECEAKGRKASHRLGTARVCPLVRPLWSAYERQPPTQVARAPQAGDKGPAVGASSAAVVRAGDPPAQTAVVPGRPSGGDASQGSSPRSPPGKKARVATDPLTNWEEEPKPQRQPRAGPSREVEPPPSDKEEMLVDSDEEEIGLGDIGASSPSSG